MSTLTRTIRQDGVQGSIQIKEQENGLLDIQIYGTQGALKGSCFIRRDAFIAMLEKFWPGEVAAQFKEKP